MTEARLLEAAADGDGAAYAELVHPHRRLLHAHCYRMLASVQDAEDAVQETLLRAWRGLPSYRGRSSLRSWLYAIATNVCLRAIERRPRRVLPTDYGPAVDPSDSLGPPLAESTWIEPYADPGETSDGGLAGPEARYEQRESLELAFIAALQHLPPRQRAVLILRDVLGFSGAEVAEALDTTAASIYSVLQRAHESVERRMPERSQQATLRALGDERLRQLVESYMGAWERHDVDTLASMLTDDATLAMPPTPTWYRGRSDVAAGLRNGPLDGTGRWSLRATVAGGQAAVMASLWNDAAGRFVRHHTAVLTLRGAQIEAVDAFHH